MAGFFRPATTVCTGGAIVGAGVLMLLPSAPEGSLRVPSMLATVRVSDLPRATCKEQFWLNADRVCQSWTTPKPDIKRVLSARLEPVQNTVPADNVTVVQRAPMSAAIVPTPAPRPMTAMVLTSPTAVESDEAPRPIAILRETRVSTELKAERASGDPRLLASETVGEVQARVFDARQSHKPRTARVARGADTPSEMPVAARWADGSPRVIMIRPTSRQDALYYSARRELAAITPRLPQ
jgi:hypothetical protein